MEDTCFCKNTEILTTGFQDVTLPVHDTSVHPDGFTAFRNETTRTSDLRALNCSVILAGGGRTQRT